MADPTQEPPATGPASGDPSQDRRLSESLRDAVERTFAATADSAAETRTRAQDLLDEVSRRGHGAREEMSRRGQEARDVSASAASKVVDTIESMRLTSREETKILEAQVSELIDVVAALDERADALGKRVSALESKPKVEG